MGQAISTEGRAMYNVGQSGLSYFAPNVNIYRYKRTKLKQDERGIRLYGDMLMLFSHVFLGTHDGGEDRRRQEKVSV